MNMDNLSIRNKILFGISIALLLMLAVSATVFVNVQGLQETSKWVEHTQNVMSKGNQLTADMVNMETGMRGFLVAGREDFLEPYDKGKRDFSKVMTQAQQLVSDNPAQVSRLERIDELAQQWIKKAGEAQIDLRRKVNIGFDTIKNFEELQKSIVGKKIFDNLRKALSRLDKEFKRENSLAGRFMVQTILLDLINMETGQRGFLLTGKDESLDPYKQGQSALDAHLEDLRELISEEKTGNLNGSDVEEIAKLADRWMEKAANPEINARMGVNQVPATMNDLILQLDKGEGKRYMDELRMRIDEFISIERNLMLTRSAAAKESASNTQFVIIAGTLAAVFLGFLAAFMIARKIATPMGSLVKILDSMAEGDISRNAVSQGTDEIAQLADSFNKMVSNLRRQVELTTLISQGNLENEVPLASEKDSLGKALQAMTNNLNETLHQVASAADQLSKGAQQLANSSQVISQGAAEQSASLEEISTSMEEMSAQTASNADNATQANELANSARQKAEEGDSQMGKMLDSMQEINESSENISVIIKTIDEIAFQTNVLAINAAVEAARAGIHGKGFAVVAEEVRNLAQRSASAAKETTIMINASVKRVEAGAKIADQTAGSLKEIVKGSAQVTELVNHIATASNEQARGVKEINNGLSQLNQITQQNAQVSGQASTASDELSGQSKALKQLVSRFKLRQQFQNTMSAYQTAPTSVQFPISPVQAPMASMEVKNESVVRDVNGGMEAEELISFDQADTGKF